ncbi:MAG TPA: type II secretion system protein E [Thermomicrobiaceae bacterium]|nr:type II secretion system protein E [Thermomicrobiaceae bacterium]
MAQRSPRARHHDEPFGWWGYRADRPVPLSVVELIARGSLDARLAGFLWLALERRASVVVAARPPEAGKTTTLTALLDFLPVSVRPIYLRGWYERFEFLDETTPEQAYLLCNEISSHLPTYLWGRGVRRLFAAMRDGYGMATTVHAGGAAEVVDLLAAYPLEVPPELIRGIDLVLTLGVGLGPGGPVRRVMRLERIGSGDGWPVPETIAARDVLLGALDAPAGRLTGVLVERFGLEPAAAIAELAGREHFLERLRDRGVRSVEAVRRELRAWTGEPRGTSAVD